MAAVIATPPDAFMRLQQICPNAPRKRSREDRQNETSDSESESTPSTPRRSAAPPTTEPATPVDQMIPRFPKVCPESPGGSRAPMVGPFTMFALGTPAEQTFPTPDAPPPLKRTHKWIPEFAPI